MLVFPARVPDLKTLFIDHNFRSFPARQLDICTNIQSILYNGRLDCHLFRQFISLQLYLSSCKLQQDSFRGWREPKLRKLHLRFISLRSVLLVAFQHIIFSAAQSHQMCFHFYIAIKKWIYCPKVKKTWIVALEINDPLDKFRHVCMCSILVAQLCRSTRFFVTFWDPCVWRTFSDCRFSYCKNPCFSWSLQRTQRDEK